VVARWRWPWARGGREEAVASRANPAWTVILQEIGNYTDAYQQPPFEQDFAEYLKATKLMPVFMAALSRVVNAAATVPWLYCTRKGDVLEPERSKLAQVFEGYQPRTPNPLAGPLALRCEMFQQRAMLGELYLCLDGPATKPTEVMVLRSASCGPVLTQDPKIQIVDYEYGYRQGRSVRIPRDLVIFDRAPHPADPVRGLSPIAILEQTFRALAPFYGLQASTMKNGARMGGILVLKGAARTTPEERKALGESFDKRFGGSNAGKTAVIQAEDADWKQTAMTSRDAEFSQLYDIMRREILNVLGVPPGLMDSKDVNRSNMREQRAMLYTDAVRPMVDSVLESINRHPWALAAGEYVKADWEQIEALQPNALEEAQTIATLIDKRVLTRNEARERMGLPPVEGGDDFPEPVDPLAALRGFGAGGNGNGNGKPEPKPEDEEVPA